LRRQSAPPPVTPEAAQLDQVRISGSCHRHGGHGNTGSRQCSASKMLSMIEIVWAGWHPARRWQPHRLGKKDAPGRLTIGRSLPSCPQLAALSARSIRHPGRRNTTGDTVRIGATGARSLLGVQSETMFLPRLLSACSVRLLAQTPRVPDSASAPVEQLRREAATQQLRRERDFLPSTSSS